MGTVAPPKNVGKGTIVTYTGRVIRPLDPDPELIDLEDIAHALSNICRFTGHVSSFYSVAQHTIYVASLVPKKLKKAALLHDASEAYLSDLARPIKQMEGLGDVYKDAEANLEAAIAEKFGLDYPWDKTIMDADLTMLRMEQRDLMPYHSEYDGPELPLWKINPLSPKDSKRIWLMWAKDLGVA